MALTLVGYFNPKRSGSAPASQLQARWGPRLHPSKPTAGSLGTPAAAESLILIAIPAAAYSWAKSELAGWGEERV